MNYRLDVEIPSGDGEAEAAEITPQLSALAIVYGGSVNFGQSQTAVKSNYQCQVVNLADANGTLLERIDNLKKRFPCTVFSLQKQET